jgi:hypothetical protein
LRDNCLVNRYMMQRTNGLETVAGNDS